MNWYKISRQSDIIYFIQKASDLIYFWIVSPNVNPYNSDLKPFRITSFLFDEGITIARGHSYLKDNLPETIQDFFTKAGLTEVKMTNRLQFNNTFGVKI